MSNETRTGPAWELIHKAGTSAGHHSMTKRLKIPGGWLVKVLASEGVGLTFVPDPDHGQPPQVLHE